MIKEIQIFIRMARGNNFFKYLNIRQTCFCSNIWKNANIKIVNTV